MRADHGEVIRLLKIARGQIDGIMKMVEEDGYCMNISTQLMAAQSILRKTNLTVLKAHMECCVREAVDNGDLDEKMAELSSLMDKLASG